jgi:hypothetical protein
LSGMTTGCACVVRVRPMREPTIYIPAQCLVLQSTDHPFPLLKKRKEKKRKEKAEDIGIGAALIHFRCCSSSPSMARPNKKLLPPAVAVLLTLLQYVLRPSDQTPFSMHRVWTSGAAAGGEHAWTVGALWSSVHVRTQRLSLSRGHGDNVALPCCSCPWT